MIISCTNSTDKNKKTDRENYTFQAITDSTFYAANFQSLIIDLPKMFSYRDEFISHDSTLLYTSFMSKDSLLIGTLNPEGFRVYKNIDSLNNYIDIKIEIFDKKIIPDDTIYLKKELRVFKEKILSEYTNSKALSQSISFYKNLATINYKTRTSNWFLHYKCFYFNDKKIEVEYIVGQKNVVIDFKKHEIESEKIINSIRFK